MDSASRRRRDSGAAAVEFALVAPVLFLLLFGIIDYGMYFADELSLRDSARSAARSGAMGDFGTQSQNGSPTPMNALSNCSHGKTGGGAAQAIACNIVNNIQTFSGAPSIKITALDPTGTERPPGTFWLRGDTLRVCIVERHSALLPLIPMPGGGIQRARVDMPIEEDLGVQSLYSDNDLSAQNWSWC